MILNIIKVNNEIINIMTENPHNLIGVIHSDPEVSSVIEDFLQLEGYQTAVQLLAEVKEDIENYIKFVRRNNSVLLVLEIAYPYIEHLRLFEQILGLDISQGRKFVLVTCDLKDVEKYLERGGGKMEVLEFPEKIGEVGEYAERALTELPKDHNAHQPPAASL